MGGSTGVILDVVTAGTWTVIRTIAKAFGIYTHEETFTDIQVSNLLTPGVAAKEAKRRAHRVSNGNLSTYFRGYRGFQNDYRRKYSKRFLTSAGYAPSSTAETRTIITSMVETLLQNIYGYVDVNVESALDKYLTIQEKGQHAIRTLSGYDWDTGSVAYDSKVYVLSSYAEVVDPETIAINMKQTYIENIVDYLTANYGYDGTYIYDGGEKYLVGELVDLLNSGDQYETICVHQPVEPNPQLPDLIVYTQAIRHTFEVTNSAYDSEASYVAYRVTSGEVGTHLRYWVAIANTQDIYGKAVVDITAVIPLKENNAMVDLDAKKLERMLRKLNLSGEMLRTSIENPDMDSAYLWTGIDPQYDDPITNKVMFKMFDLMSAGSGNVVIAINKLNMRYAFTVQKSTVIGSIGPVGTVTRSSTGSSSATDGEGGSSNTYVMTLQVQVDANEYQQIVVSNFSLDYTVSGHSFTAYLDSTGGYCRLLIPLNIYNSLRYKEFEWIYERSLSLLAFSLEVVTVKWYETSAFGALLKIVAFVITIYTLGAASSIGKALLIMAAGMAVAYAISWIGDQIGGTLGMIFKIVATVVAMYYGGMDFSSVDTWLMVANQSIGVINQTIQHKTEELIREASIFEEDFKKKMDELDEAAEKYEDNGLGWFNMFDSAYAGRPNTSFQTIEEYCNTIVGNTDMSYLIDYGRQIDYNLLIRETVRAS